MTSPKYMANVLTVVVVLLAGSQVQAALLAQESFNYSVGALPGNGSAADPGWAGAWGGAGNYVVDSASLSYPDYPNAGNRVGISGGSWNNAARTLDVTGAFAAYQEDNGLGNVIGADGTKIWTSFLLRGRPRQGHATSSLRRCRKRRIVRLSPGTSFASEKRPWTCCPMPYPNLRPSPSPSSACWGCWAAASGGGGGDDTVPKNDGIMRHKKTRE